MKLQKQDEFSMGFPLPDPGTYRVEIQEGVEISTYTNAKNETKSSFHIPTKIVDDDNFENIPVHIFIQLTGKDFSRKSIGGVINAAGLYESYMKKFPDESIEADDKKVLDQLSIDLPQRTMFVDLEHRKNIKTGNTQAEVVRFARTGTIAGKTATPGAAPSVSGGFDSVAAPAADAPEKTGW